MEEPHKKKKKKDDSFTGMVDADTEIMAAGLAANALGTVAAPAQLAVDMYSADRELHQNIDIAAQMMGEDARSLQANSPAFKNYVKKELPEIYGDRAVGLGFSLGGGALAMAAAGMVFGLPAGIPGMIAGLVIGIGGAMAAGVVKEYIFPSNYNSFLNFASQLQNMGQEGSMPPEAAFVALTVNLPEESLKKQVIASLPRHLRVKDEKGLIKLLEREDGREALRQAMLENDIELRASVGAVSGMPAATISEQFARLVNSKKIAGVDLLNDDKTNQIGTLIAMHEMQQAAQAPHAGAQQEPNPNAHLPRGKNNQISLNN